MEDILPKGMHESNFFRFDENQIKSFMFSEVSSIEWKFIGKAILVFLVLLLSKGRRKEAVKVPVKALDDMS